MAIASTLTRQRFPTPGAAVSFALPFRVLDPSHLVVTRVAGAVSTPLVLGTDYTVTGAGTVGTTATVTLTTPLPSAADLLVSRVVPITQPTQFTEQGAYFASNHELAFDRLTMQVQQVQTALTDLQGGVGTASAATPITVPGTTTPRTIGARFGEVFHVEDYGAVGDGVTNDRVAINAALQAAVSAGGGTVRFGPAKSYFIGPLVAETVFLLNNATDLVIEGCHSELVGQTTVQTIPSVLEFRNPTRVTIRDLNARDLDYRDNLDWWGMGFLNFISTGSGEACGRVLVENCHARDLVTFCRTTGLGTRRLQHITFVNCSAFHCYYGISSQEDGDTLRAVNFRFVNGRRAYFPYGVRDHDVDVTVAHDGSVLGASACCLIKRYIRDTRQIRLRLRMEGTGTAYSAACDIETQTDSATALIDNVDVWLDLRGVTSAASMRPVVIRAYNDAGVLQTTTGHTMTRIRLDGDLGDYASTTASAIDVQSRQTTEATLVLGPVLGALTAMRAPLMTPGFRVVTGLNREVRTVAGNLTAAPVTIPLASLDALAIPLRITIYAHGDVTVLAGQNSVIRSDVLHVVNAGAGSVSVLSSAATFTPLVQGNAPTVTYGASGENLTVTFAGSDYTGSNAYARVEVEYLARGVAV